MKKLVVFLSFVSMLGLVSCGSKKEVKEIKKEEVSSVVAVRADFVVQERSTRDNSMPKWIEKPSLGEKSKMRKKSRYFVSESEHTSKRLCIKSAQARATARIASEIAQFIKNTYAEATQGGGDEEVSEYMQEQLAQETQAFVIGSRVLENFWEKRFYKEELGAEEDKRVFRCFSLVKIGKKNLAKAVRNSQAKLLDGISNPEVKKKTNKIIKDVANKFNDVQDRVEVEEEE